MEAVVRGEDNISVLQQSLFLQLCNHLLHKIIDWQQGAPPAFKLTIITWLFRKTLQYVGFLHNAVLVTCLLSTDNVNSWMIGIEKQVETSHIPFQTPLQSKLSLLSFLILGAMNTILHTKFL